MALIKCAGFDYLTPLAPASVLASLGFNASTLGYDFRLNFSSAGAVSCTLPNYSMISSAPMAVIPGAVWQFIEVYAAISPTNGAVRVRVNEIVVLALVSSNTAHTTSTGVDQISIGTGANNVIVDDFYICDSSGTSLNGFLGNTRVPAQVPAGVGSSTGWTPTGSASANQPFLFTATPAQPNAQGADGVRISEQPFIVDDIAERLLLAALLVEQSVHPRDGLQQVVFLQWLAKVEPDRAVTR